MKWGKTCLAKDRLENFNFCFNICILYIISKVYVLIEISVKYIGVENYESYNFESYNFESYDF